MTTHWADKRINEEKNETKWRTEKTHEIGKWKRNREKSMRKKADTVLRQ